MNHKANLLQRLNIWFNPYRKLAPYIIAQAKLESENFNSPVYKKNNNAFGMKTASKRKQLGKPGSIAPDGGTYQQYTNDIQSFKDLFLWFDYTKFPTEVKTAKDYVTNLQARGYFKSSPVAYLDNINFHLINDA